MTQYAMDTDILSLYQDGHPVVTRNVVAHAVSELAASDGQLRDGRFLRKDLEQASPITNDDGSGRGTGPRGATMARVADPVGSDEREWRSGFVFFA